MKVAVLLPSKVYPSNSQAFLSFIQRENTPAVKIFPPGVWIIFHTWVLLQRGICPLQELIISFSEYALWLFLKRICFPHKTSMTEWSPLDLTPSLNIIQSNWPRFLCWWDMGVKHPVVILVVFSTIQINYFSSHHSFSFRTCSSSAGVKSFLMLNVFRISSGDFPLIMFATVLHVTSNKPLMSR